MTACFGAGVFFTRQHYKAVETVASVNGTEITKGEFYRRLEMAAGVEVLRGMAGEQLTLEYARKKGVMPTEAEVQARFDQESAKPDFDQALAQRRQTPEDFKQALRVSMAQAKALGKGIAVSDAEARKFYEANISRANPLARYYTPEQVEIAVVVTQTEARSNKALADLRQDLPFSTVAKNYSQDASKDNGGVLPPVLRGRTASRKIPGLEQALFGMKIGEQIGPRKFAGVWWIIRCLDKKPEVTQPFEKVREECRTGAMLMKGIPANAKSVETDFQKFQREANIQAFWPQYHDALRTDATQE